LRITKKNINRLNFRLNKDNLSLEFSSGMLRKVFKTLVLIPVYIYRWVISPLTPGSCRHVPTCSEYMVDAVKTHGPGQGFLMGLNRLSRCHPWGTHGYDPVPRFIIKKYKRK